MAAKVARVCCRSTVTSSIDSHRRLQRATLLLGLALVLPSLGGGFFADDFIQIAQLEGWSVTRAGPLDLYAFVPRDPAVVEQLRQQGWLPYFTAPGLCIAFLRPLSSALMWLDHTLFGRWAVPYHVHTLLWYAALLAVVAALLRRTFTPAQAQLTSLALGLFCLDDGHAMAAGWIAARNATVSCTFVFAALVAHVRWRAQGWRVGALLAPLAAALGLAAGEMALGALAYLVAWEVVHQRPGKLRALAPTLTLLAIYLLLHRLSGSGGRASGAYLDPFGDPLGFLRALPERGLLLAGNLLVAAPIDSLLFEPGLRLPLLLVSGAAVLGVAWWLPRALDRLPTDEALTVRWLGLGAAGALLVSTPALLGERVLLAASLGGAVVLAALLRDAWRGLRQPGRTRAAAGLALVLLGGPNLALAPVALLAKTGFLGRISRQALALAGTAPISAPVPARVVVIALEDLLALHLPVLRIWTQGLGPDDLQRLGDLRASGTLPLPDQIGYLGSTVLSLAATTHQLRRTAANAFELSTPTGTLFDGAWAESVRAPGLPLPRGQVIRLGYMTAVVLEDRGGRPTRVEFRFDQPLDDPSLIFLVFAQGQLRRFAPPAIGQQVDLPRGRPIF